MMTNYLNGQKNITIGTRKWLLSKHTKEMKMAMSFIS